MLAARPAVSAIAPACRRAPERVRAALCVDINASIIKVCVRCLVLGFRVSVWGLGLWWILLHVKL